VLAFQAGFGVVHVPAAVILYLDQARGEGKSKCAPIAPRSASLDRLPVRIHLAWISAGSPSLRRGWNG
jgi:hypothetical protein